MRPHTHQPLRAGGLTILTAVITICLAVLAVLSLATARADWAMSQRQLALARLNADAECTGQEWLAALDASVRRGTPLPPGTTLDTDPERTARAALPLDEKHTLLLTATTTPLRITQWQITTPWSPEPVETLWQG